MKVLIVYWHPEPQSFNHAMFVTAQHTLREHGWQVTTSDLHTMGFQPVSGRSNFISVKDPEYLKLQSEELHATEQNSFSPEVATEIEKLEACDLMIWQFPLWWFGLPAVFKGWVDRVFAMGRIYGLGRVYENGALKGRRAMLSLTTGGPPEAYQPGGFNGDIYGILRPVHRGMLEFVGFEVLKPHIVNAPVRMNDEQREAELRSYASRLASIQEETAFVVGHY